MGSGEPQALLFDLDGTLVDTERESAEAMARALRDGRGVTVSQEERDYMIGRSWVDIYRRLEAAHPGLGWSRAELIAATARERGRIFSEEGVRVLPGARAAIDRFSDRPLALVTGSSREEARQVLEVLGLERAFAAVIAAEDVPTSKPAPEGYLAAARLVDAAPASCLVVEDSSAGIAAGLAAGARVVAVAAGNFAGQDQSSAHRIISTLEELTGELLATLWGMVSKRAP